MARLPEVEGEFVVRCYRAAVADEDVFVFGAESRGLPPELHAEFDVDYRLRIPMRPGNRSLNLSNAAAVVVYEA